MAVSGNTIFINNEEVQFYNGQTILDILRGHLGEDAVPTLCDAPNLKPFGSCRVCSVEVALEKDGPTKVQASCHTPAMNGSYIYTHSEKINRLRKNIVELVLTDYPQEKFEQDNPNNNELKKVALQLGITMPEVRYDPGANHLDRKIDDSHAYMRANLSACINCYRCIRACDEVQGEMVLTMTGRGFENTVTMGMDEGFKESDCVSCGACSQACPTGAISDIYNSKLNDADTATRTVCTYCGVGCNLDVATEDDHVVGITAPYDAEVNQGHTCLKGRYAFKFYDHPERLRNPLIKRHGVFEEATWDEAYAIIVDKFNNIRNNSGPDALAGISSSRCTNEENYLMQKFIRAVVGTNNIDGCARVCHSPTALGMQRSFGTGAATNSVIDIQYTNCMMVIGANPTVAHPVTGAKIKQAAMKGTRLIVIDPRETPLAKYADVHLQLRPGTNVAMLNMLLYYIVDEGLVDLEFVGARTEGYEEFLEHIRGLDINKMEEVTGVSRELAKEAAIIYASAPNAMSFHGLGVTEHSQGTFTVMQIADLAMLTGNIGRRGVGVNPLRGQNNVQGSADMGVQPHQGAGYLDITKPEIQELYEQHYKVELPKKVGYKIPEMFDAAIDGKLKAIWIIGEDVVQTDPNTAKVKKALESMDFVVVQELFMTETAKMADIVLPGASFLEKSGTFTNGERRVQRVNKVVEPIGNAKADGQIIIDVMNLMGYNQPDYTAEAVLDEVSQIVPFFRGIKWHELGENGKQWPVAEDGKSTDMIHTSEFKRGKGRIEFFDWQESAEITEHSSEFPYIITTNRDLEHYNCGAMTRRTGNVEINSEDVLWINFKDAIDNDINDGDMVCVTSARGKVDIKARLTDDVKPGVMSTTFHFPEIMINMITSDVHDSEAKCPEYKVVAVKIRKSKGEFARI